MKWILCSQFGFWLLLIRLPVSTGQSQVICSPQPIVALAGDDVILPCHLEPATTDFSGTVEWTRPDLDPEYIHVHQSGRLVLAGQNPQYKYRTVLFVDELKNGNVSLKLFSVTISDEGTYRLFIPSMWKEAFIQLHVGSVSSPVIEITKSSSGVVLECECKGWYPEPELFWLDGEGNILSAGPPETVRGPDGLYTVSSRVTVEKTDTNSFTCRAQQLSINQTRDTQVQVPDGVCPSRAAVSIFIVLAVLLLCVVAVFFVVCKWRRDKNKTKMQPDDETEQREENQHPISASPNNTEVHVLMEEERDRQQLTAEGEAEENLKIANLEEELQRKENERKLWEGERDKLKGQQSEQENQTEELKSRLEEAERQRDENKRKLQETERQKEAAEREKKEFVRKTKSVLTDRRRELEKQLQRTKESWFTGWKEEMESGQIELLKEIQRLMDLD